MVRSSESVNDRRIGVPQVMARLQAERAEMLVLFCRLAGLEPYGREPDLPRLLQTFCQTLVDYIAGAHFLLYERIVNGTERRRRMNDLADGIYPQIQRCTDLAIDFNDKYDCEDHCENLDQLSDDLSRLGEALAERIELEDRLLGALTASAA